MGDFVFVNGRSVVHKGSMAKSTAFPCVNLCPPSPPTGPIPVPLPNLAQAADLAGGATSVLVEGNPMAKRSSYLAKSTGNSMARGTGGGVITHVVEGKAYFTSFSMDVTAEGEEVPRHLDMMTHNHASPPGNSFGVLMGTMMMGALPPSPSKREAKRKPTETTFEVCIDAPEPGTWPNIQLELVSSDHAYKQSHPLNSATKKNDALLALSFTKVLPGKRYQLFYVIGSQRIALFPNLKPFEDLMEHNPGEGGLETDTNTLSTITYKKHEREQSPTIHSEDDFIQYNPIHENSNLAWYSGRDPRTEKK